MESVLCGFGSRRQPEGTSRNKQGLELNWKAQFISAPVGTLYGSISEHSRDSIVMAKWKIGFSILLLSVHTGFSVSANT